MARQAVTLNDSLPWAHATLGWVLLYKRQYEEAISQGEQTLRLGESDYGASYVLLAEIKNYTGRPEAAIELVETAMRLDSPFYADLYAFSLGTAYYLTGQHEEAIAALRGAL
jgi:tetratricopeptide (TPR) repeat protein